MNEAGQIIAERWRNVIGENWIHIVRADPQAMISGELVAILRAPSHPADSDVRLEGDVLTIDADNGRWIYRLGDYDPELDAYRMEWPD